jgi:outer membrane translocation and assembly module TamA
VARVILAPAFASYNLRQVAKEWAVMPRFVLAFAILFASNAALAQNTPSISVRNLTLVNLTQVPVEDYQQIVQFALSDDNTKFSPGDIPQRVRYALQERGYFRAQVGDAETTVVSETPTESVADVTLRVEAGSQYTLREIILRGVKAFDVFSTEQMRAQFVISPGDIFDTEKVRKSIENLRKLFADDGYINFTPAPETQVQDETKTIVLSVSLDLGPRFYFGDLVPTSASGSPGAASTLISDWAALTGKAYSGTELEDFMKQHGKLLPSGFRIDRNLQIRQDVKTKTVNVEVLP